MRKHVSAAGECDAVQTRDMQAFHCMLSSGDGNASTSSLHDVLNDGAHITCFQP
jgi:hypothetical protein